MSRNLKRAGFRGTLSGPLQLSRWFHTGPINPLNAYDLYDHPYARIVWTSPGWFGTRLVRNTMQVIFVCVTPSLGKKQILSLYENVLRKPVYSISSGKKRIPRRLVEHLLVCSFKKTSVARVMETLPLFRFDRTIGELVWSGEQELPEHKTAGYDELYVGYMLSGQPTFIVRGQKKRDERLETRGTELFGPRGTKLGLMKKVSRYVHIRLLHTESKKVLETSLSDILSELK